MNTRPSFVSVFTLITSSTLLIACGDTNPTEGTGGGTSSATTTTTTGAEDKICVNVNAVKVPIVPATFEAKGLDGGTYDPRQKLFRFSISSEMFGGEPVVGALFEVVATPELTLSDILVLNDMDSYVAAASCSFYGNHSNSGTVDCFFEFQPDVPPAPGGIVYTFEALVDGLSPTSMVTTSVTAIYAGYACDGVKVPSENQTITM